MPNPTPTQPAGPMVTVKKADGTMVKVPLSEIRKKKLGNEEITKQGNEEMKKLETASMENKPAISSQSSAISKDQRTLQQPNSELRTPNSERLPQTLAEGIELILKERKLMGENTATAVGGVPPEGGKSTKTGNNEITKLRNEEIKGTPNSERRTPKADWAADDHKSLLDDEFHKENLPMVIEARQKALAKVRPVSALRAEFTRRGDGPGKPMALQQKNTENTKTQKTQPAIGNQTSATRLQQLITDRSQKSDSRSPIKPMMHDVQPPAPSPDKRSLGPVDELRSFSLSDLRHLDVTPQAAQSKLAQKFETLKEESYLLYMEAVRAWRESPLYRQYQDVLLRSLTSRQTVNQILGESRDREAMKMEEWGAVVKVNQSLV